MVAETKESIVYSTFFSAWRPLIGWVSVISLAITFIIIPIVKIFAAFYKPEANIPNLDVAPLIGLITSVLGMGGLRTIEKITGVNS